MDFDHSTGPVGKFIAVTPDAMERELRAAHPLLMNTRFTEGPNWTDKSGEPLPGQKQANISFTVPDPDDSILSAITHHPLLMFTFSCQATKWTEKVNLTQCTCCWKYGDKVHPDCPIRCCQCGGQHSEETHNCDCKCCEKSDINQEDRKEGKTVCAHTIRCPNCTEEHMADDDGCCMRGYAACEE